MTCRITSLYFEGAKQPTSLYKTFLSSHSLQGQQVLWYYGTEGSSPRSQEPANGPYLAIVPSTPYFFKIHTTRKRRNLSTSVLFVFRVLHNCKPSSLGQYWCRCPLLWHMQYQSGVSQIDSASLQTTVTYLIFLWIPAGGFEPGTQCIAH
jgi:hypothetical protein